MTKNSRPRFTGHFPDQEGWRTRSSPYREGNASPTEPSQEAARAPAPEPAKDLSADPKVKYFQTEYPDIYEGTDILGPGQGERDRQDLFKGEFDKLNQRLNAVEQGQVQKTKNPSTRP